MCIFEVGYTVLMMYFVYSNTVVYLYARMYVIISFIGKIHLFALEYLNESCFFEAYIKF